MQKFSTLSLPANLLNAVEALGYSGMTDVQAGTLPVMLAQQDEIGRAHV